MTIRLNSGPKSLGSHHGAIAHVVFADGSVEVIRDNVDSETLRNLIQPADGSIIARRVSE